MIQLVAANSTADSLLDLLLAGRKEVPVETAPLDSPTGVLASSSVTCDATAGICNRGVPAGPSNTTGARLPKMNPKGPVELFVPGTLTLDGHGWHQYNGFVFDLPAPDATGEVYLVTRGQRVGIFDTWCTLRPSGDFQANKLTLTRIDAFAQIDTCDGCAYTAVKSEDDAMVMMMDAIDKGTACWLKG